VTEALLKEAMEAFGAVSMVEIDKRKGFAYVDFVDTEGLKKAMAANPISVAQGTVQVMQRKGTALPPEKKPVHQPPNAPSRGGRGGRGGTMGRRGGRGGARGAAQAGPPEPGKVASTVPTGPSAK
jgi:regulator of nonsense transcripts 3